MSAFLSRAKRPLLAAAMMAVFTAGAASAASSYYIYEPPVFVEVDYAPCGPICPPPAPISYVPAPPEPPPCSPCVAASKTFGLGRTDLPGWYSDDYDYTVSSQRDIGITYLVPTRNGLIESNRIPLTNPVDQYYATHEEINGKVVDLTNSANRALENQNTRDYINDPMNRVQNKTAALQSGLAPQVQPGQMNQTPSQATVNGATRTVNY